MSLGMVGLGRMGANIVRRLMRDGHRCVVYDVNPKAAEALAALQSGRPDVIVSDIGMPEVDGFTLIRRVRALSAEQGGRTPAIALTAYARAEDRVKAVVSGFQHHLSKPVEPMELIAVVASLVDRR